MNGIAESDLKIAYFNETEHWVTTAIGNVSTSDNIVDHNFFTQDLLKITATGTNSILPVTLIQFTATKQENIAVLSWETAEESNSDHFEIQRSGDGKSWEALAEVKARGESKTNVSYNYTDNAPLNGENLYRLKMIDNDGTFAYSRIASLEFEEEETLSVYPNPFTSKLHIELPDWTKYHQIEIYTANGRALPIALVPGPDANKKAFDLGNAPAGVYLIKATRQDGTSVTNKVIKR
ncbi:T9SS type A sorting domain-containing protein [Dyadobacter luticola]|uniref:T9SS type A sorting domain-containing protein n=1 Tax=Dyadobacter luticola TaxID=1979387 RepID=UPI001485E3ED|nr:T9SS type A sorting domain-containing protein [Dyadobacter luticola]